AGIENLLAELLDEEGASEEAWEHRYNVLRIAGEIADPQRLYQLLSLMALACHSQGQEKLALYFQDEAVFNAREMNNQLPIANALFWHANYLHRLHLDSRASEELTQGRIAAEQLSDGAEKERLLSEIFLAEAQVRYNNDSEDSIPLLTKAIEHSRGVSKRFDNKVALYLARARAFRASGSIDLAESDLNRGVLLVEDLRSRLDEDTYRGAFLDKVRDMYDEMVMLQLQDRKNAGLALEYAERSRARALLDLLLVLPGKNVRNIVISGATSNEREIRKGMAELPGGVVIITLGLVGDYLVTWVSDRSGLRQVSVTLAARRVQTDIEMIGKAIDYGSESLFNHAISDLYNVLIRPVRTAIPAGSALVFSCDGLLQRVPFSSLFDTTSNRYLVEDFEISVVPGAMVYFRILERNQELNRPSRFKALIIANPSVDHGEFPDLPSLPEAAREGSRITALYRDSLILEGASATKSRFLQEASNYNVIQFLGHAIASEDKPLRSRLIFAGAPGEGNLSGSLYVNEIYDLKLKNPWLAVLSACGTERGYVSSSEGTQSATRAFLVAGVPAVVGSLWNVDDLMAAELLWEFNLHIAEGGSPSRALRLAQLRLLRHPDHRYSSPMNWSVFQLAGGWV